MCEKDLNLSQTLFLLYCRGILEECELQVQYSQRVCTSREEKGRRMMLEGCQAGGLGRQLQYMREDNAESPKQGRKKFNSIIKTISFDHLVIFYL